jgi:hypothetical protein
VAVQPVLQAKCFCLLPKHLSSSARFAARVVRDIYCRMKGIPNTSSDQSTAEQYMLNRGQQGSAAGLARQQSGGARVHAATAAAAAAMPAHPAHAHMAAAPVHPPMPGGNAPAPPSLAAPVHGQQLYQNGVRPGTGAPRGRNNTQIRCICSMQTARGQMIQCEVRPVWWSEGSPLVFACLWRCGVGGVQGLVYKAHRGCGGAYGVP